MTAECGLSVKSKLLTALIAALALFAFLAIMLEMRAGAELDRARALAAEGDYAAADRHYFQSLNWYAPWGSSQKAADELLALGLEHSRSGREAEAFQSMLRLRSALIAARSFYQPRRDILKTATPVIALSLAHLKLGPDASPESVAAQALAYQTLYSSAASRGQLWYFLIVFNFLLWVGAAFHFVFAYFRERKPLERASGRKMVFVSLAVFAFGYLMWLFSMTMT